MMLEDTEIERRRRWLQRDRLDTRREVARIDAVRRQRRKVTYLAAFDQNDLGELVLVFGPRLLEDEQMVVRSALMIMFAYEGIVAWTEQADKGEGLSEKTVVFQLGAIPEDWQTHPPLFQSNE